MSRLRKVIGAENLGSRPYRLLTPITSDVGEVFDALDAGDVESALARYAGPLLTQSVSPGDRAVAHPTVGHVARRRARRSGQGRPDLLRRWLELPEGRDDRDGWQVLHDSAGPTRWRGPRPAAIWPAWTSNSAEPCPRELQLWCNRAATLVRRSFSDADTSSRSRRLTMTVYARPGTEGSLMSFKPRYDNFIGGEWVRPPAGRYFENPTPVTGQTVLRGRPLRRDRHREGARRRARRRARLGQDLGRRARGDPQQDRRPHRGEPRVDRGGRVVGQRQADPRDAQRRHPAGRGSLPLLRRVHPRAGGFAVARSTTTPSPTTSTSRSASSGRSSRGTSRS